MSGCVRSSIHYDSLLFTKINFETKEQICALVCTTSKSIRLDVMNIMRQPNDYDCGLFSIANIIALAVGLNPGKCVWDTDKTRRSVEHCTPHADGAWLNELGWSQ